MSKCSVCDSTMAHSFSATLLKRYEVSYYQCPQCGLLQTEEPYWLDEAYCDVIAIADTGLVQRNISIAVKLASLIYLDLDSKGAYLDVAGGYGMLTRLMRDFGFDFYWSDNFCQNLLARGFEADKAREPFNALTAFEVLEHTYNPISFITEMMDNFDSRTMIFSTEIYQGEPPPVDWWYYAFNTGQHISFYQSRTLQFIADQLGLKLFSSHGIHILTDQQINKWKFKLLTGRFAYPIELYVKRKMLSKTMDDHYLLINTDHHNH